MPTASVGMAPSAGTSPAANVLERRGRTLLDGFECFFRGGLYLLVWVGEQFL